MGFEKIKCLCHGSSTLFSVLVIDYYCCFYGLTVFLTITSPIFSNYPLGWVGS